MLTCVTHVTVIEKKEVKKILTFRVLRPDGKEVKAGDAIQSFRGETYTFLEVVQGGSRIHARAPEGFTHEYYPNVFNLTVKREEAKTNG